MKFFDMFKGNDGAKLDEEKNNSHADNPKTDSHKSPSTLKEGSPLQNNYKDEIFTKRVRAGKRTYFFDVKSTKSEKDFFLTITESKRVGEQQYEKHKIFLYKEDFQKFRTALDETVSYIQTNLLKVDGVAVEQEKQV